MKNHTHTPYYCCGVPVTDSCPVCGATGLTAARFASEVETAEIQADVEFSERLELSKKQAAEGKTVTLAEAAERLDEESSDSADADNPETPAPAKRGKKKKA